MKCINSMLVGTALLVLTLLAPRFTQAQELALAEAQELDLRVLVITPSPWDAGLALMTDMMDTLGTPYEVLDASQETLTVAKLMDGDRGRFNGIILTQATGHGLSPEALQLLHDYERLNDVAESVLAGWPAWAPGSDADHAMTNPLDSTGAQAQWVGEAGGARIFEYVNEQAPMQLDPEYAVAFEPRNDDADPQVSPLLVRADSPTHQLISELRYENGRRVLLSTVSNGSWMIHSQVLAYEFLNYATSGIFIGARRVFLSAHTDDLFLPDELWDSANNKNFPEYGEGAKVIRMDDVDVVNAAAQHKAFKDAHPLAAGLRFEFSFNGIGAGGNEDLLLSALKDDKQTFRYINHTFAALQMDRICPDPDDVPAPTLEDCPVTDYATAYAEIDDNREFWQKHRFTQYRPNFEVLLTDSHSGLSDRRNYPESSDQSLHNAFPDGANPWFLSAAQDLGVRVLAADASRTNQDEIRRIGFVTKTNELGETLSGDFSNIAILPRYPTAIYYNTYSPVENTDEYNYIHYERYLCPPADQPQPEGCVPEGQRPCDSIPGSICEPRSYEGILAAEADTTFRHMLSYKPFPHYFHQGNLINYERSAEQAEAAASAQKGKKPPTPEPEALGRTLQTDWLDAVMGKYESMLKLPVETLEFHQLTNVVWQTIAQQEALVEGTLRKTVDLEGNVTRTVTLQAQGNPGEVYVTGIRNAANEVQYGGQWQSRVPVSQTPVEFVVDEGASLIVGGTTAVAPMTSSAESVPVVEEAF